MIENLLHVGANKIKTGVKTVGEHIAKALKELFLTKRIMTNNRDIKILDETFHEYFKKFREKFKPGDQILELGPGDGVALKEIEKKMPGVKILGLDKDPKYENSEGPIRQYDLENGLAGGLEKLGLAGKNSLDYVYSFYALQYTKNGPDLLNQAYQALKPGGKAILHIGLGGAIEKKFRNALVQENGSAREKGAIDFLTIRSDKNKLFRKVIMLTKKQRVQEIKIPEYAPSKGEYWKDTNGNILPYSDARYRYELR